MSAHQKKGGDLFSSPPQRPALPPVPFLPTSTRLANLNDLSRIAEIAALGFKSSQVFQYERPLHAEYPGDTVEDYQRRFSRRIKGGRWVVVVAEDSALSFSDGDKDRERNKEIIGVCCWKLPEGSWRIGRFGQGKIENGENGETEEWISRDKSPSRAHLVSAAISTAHSKHFPPEKTLIVDMVTVHPFYQRRGHGRKLISWGLELAKLDNLGVGTVASNMGNLLFVALGFKELERPKIGEEEEENEKWIEVCVVGYPGEV